MLCVGHEGQLAVSRTAGDIRDAAKAWQSSQDLRGMPTLPQALPQPLREAAVGHRGRRRGDPDVFPFLGGKGKVIINSPGVTNADV